MGITHVKTGIAGAAGLLLGTAFAALAASSALAQQAPLRIAIPGFSPQQAFPYGGNAFYAPGIYSFSPIFDTLTFIGADGNIQPGLATAWKNIDATTWQFTVRPGVTFANGKSVTAEALVRNIELITSEYGATTKISTIVPSPASARVVDANTIEIRTKTPNPVFEREISGLPVVEPDAWKDLGVEAFSRTPVGAGPFKVTKATWTDGAIELEPHAGSWRPGKVAKLVLLAVPERATRMQAVESGQVEIGLNVGIDDIDRIRKAGYSVYSAPVASMTAFAMMSTRPNDPFRDVRVRQAANHAVDKEAIVKNLLGGMTNIMSQAAVPGSNGFNADVKPYAHDPAKAKQLLAAAGYPNGFKTKVEVTLSGGGGLPNDEAVYQQVAADLGKVGITTEVVAITFNDFLKRWFPAQGVNELGFADMFTTGYSLAPQIDAIATFSNNWCDKKPSWYCNEALRPLVDQARSEFDPAKRRAVLQQLMKALNEDAPALFLVQQFDIVAVSPKVKNFAINNRFINYSDFTVQ